MKIAIPTSDGTLCAHFGHCQQFAIIDVNQDTKSINNTEMLTPPPHEPGVLPAWLSQMGCKIIIAGGMGNRALTLFEQNGIHVVTGAPSLVPEELVQSYLDNSLVSGNNLCDH